MKTVYLLPFLLLLLAMPGAATTITANGVSSYTMVADPGMIIYQITINDLPIGTNQSHILNAGDGAYLLTIDTYKEWGFNNADISLTSPNSSVQTVHVSALGVLVGSYKTNIQYVYPQIYSGGGGGTTVYLTLGLTPLTAAFNAGAIGWDPETSLAFSSVSGNLGGTTDVYVEEMTAADFQKDVQNYNPANGLLHLGSQVFQWTYNGVLGFISMIPVIGPITVLMISSMGGVIGTGYFWMAFVIMNFPAVLAGIECLILMFAVINAGTGKNSMFRLSKNVVNYNVAFAVGVISLVNIVWGWTKSAVEMVTSIVQALKPI